MRSHRSSSRLGRALEVVSEKATHAVGTSWAFSAALFVVIVWAALGPVFSFSNKWQLVINSSTTIVTFLMVFLIQRAQNKESLAIQLKLNELVAAVQGCSNRLIDVEDLSEEELETLHEHYRKLARMAKRDSDVKSSHSIEEAESRHVEKHGSGKRRSKN